jgi:hypothetical protein
VARAFDALHGTKWRHSNLNGVALGSGAELFEQVTHGCGELRMVSRSHRCDGLLALLGLYLSAHWFILA